MLSIKSHNIAAMHKKFTNYIWCPNSSHKLATWPGVSH